MVIYQGVTPWLRRPTRCLLLPQNTLPERPCGDAPTDLAAGVDFKAPSLGSPLELELSGAWAEMVGVCGLGLWDAEVDHRPKLFEVREQLGSGWRWD